MKISRGELAIILLIVGLTLSLGWAIVSTAHGYERQEELLALPYKYPKIPKCDLPLWDRIRFLCPGDKNE